MDKKVFHGLSFQLNTDNKHNVNRLKGNPQTRTPMNGSLQSFPTIYLLGETI